MLWLAHKDVVLAARQAQHHQLVCALQASLPQPCSCDKALQELQLVGDNRHEFNWKLLVTCTVQAEDGQAQSTALATPMYEAAAAQQRWMDAAQNLHQPK